ncbi:MAG: hypothetical protein LBK67_00665, partial [Coriobacteriales bacterium]|nr:hypothetical protein [Coriobacteriales bacterium]
MLKGHRRVLGIFMTMLLVVTMMPPVTFAEEIPLGTTFTGTETAQGGEPEAASETDSSANQDEPITTGGESTTTPDELAQTEPEPALADKPAEALNANVLPATESTQDTSTPSLVTPFALDPETQSAEGGSLNAMDAEGVFVDRNTFPDDNFREYVLGRFGYHPGEEPGEEPGQNPNEGIWLSPEQIAEIVGIDVAGRYVADLTGIKYFTALVGLRWDGWNGWDGPSTLDVSGL